MKLVCDVMRALVILAAASVLVACGGGGESPSTPPPPPSPTLESFFPTLDVQSPVTDTFASRSVELTIRNLSDTVPIHVGGSYSNNGIQTLTASSIGGQIYLNLTFRRPTETKPGIYTDTITIRACLESPCVTQIAGSPRTITVTYSVVMPPDPPRMTLSRSSFDIQAFILDSPGPGMQEAEVTFSSLGAASAPFVDVTETTNGIYTADFGNVSRSSGRLLLPPRPPAVLGAGTYTDVVTVKSCLAVNCVNELAGSPATVNVNYVVSNTLPGPNGFTARIVAAVPNDMVWDAARQVFYLSMSGRSANPNTIGVLDPVTGQVQSFVPVGAEPGDMEISPDGQYLYVALRGAGTIQRLRLPSLALDLEIPVGRRPDDVVLYAREIHVAPGSPRTLGVVRSAMRVASNPEYDLAVFDDAVMRAQQVGTSTQDRVTTFQWDSDARIFGVDSNSSVGAALQVAVAANGLQVTASQQNVTAFDGEAHLVNGRIYMELGRVFDPVTFAQLGAFQFDDSFGVAMTADASTGRAFYLLKGILRSYDLASLAPIASVPIPLAAPAAGWGSKAVRWGHDGLAFPNYQGGLPGILLINGPFVRP